MSKSAVSAHLTLIGDDFDVNYVTNTLDIIPNYLRDKNEILGNGRIFGHTEWGIGTDYEESLDIEIQFEQIYSVVHGKENVLSQIAKECTAEWHVVFVIKIKNDVVPAVGFTKQMIELFYKIGAQVGFDMYVL